jgi:hypothetical protein
LTYVRATWRAVPQPTPIPLIWNALPFATEPQPTGVAVVDPVGVCGTGAFWFGTGVGAGTVAVGSDAAVLTVGPGADAVCVTVFEDPQPASAAPRPSSKPTLNRRIRPNRSLRVVKNRIKQAGSA